MYLLVDPGFLSLPLNFYEASRLVSPIGWTPLTDTTDKGVSLLLAVGGGEGGDRFLSQHELRPSVGPVLNPYPHNGVCVCVSAQGQGVRMCICACCEQSLSNLF